MVEEPSEGESDLSVADDLQENFPRSKWIGNCTEANGPEDPEAQDLFSSAQRQRACDPHLLEEQVGSSQHLEEQLLITKQGEPVLTEQQEE